MSTVIVNLPKVSKSDLIVITKLKSKQNGLRYFKLFAIKTNFKHWTYLINILRSLTGKIVSVFGAQTTTNELKSEHKTTGHEKQCESNKLLAVFCVPFKTLAFFIAFVKKKMAMVYNHTAVSLVMANFFFH